MIVATRATADANFGNGFNIMSGGIIDANTITSTNNRGRGINAYAGGTFYSFVNGTAPAATISGNWGDGVSAGQTSNVIIPGATVTYNGATDAGSGNGIGVFNGSSVDASDSNVTANDGAGFTSWLGGMIAAPRSFANGNLRGDGYMARCARSTPPAARRRTTRTTATRRPTAAPSTPARAGTTAPTRRTLVKRSLADDNGQAGFRSTIGGVIEARDSDATDNNEDGYHAWTGATLLADRSSSSGNHQNGYGSYANLAINAPGSSATLNWQNGFHVGLGGVIEATAEYSNGVASTADHNGAASTPGAAPLISAGGVDLQRPRLQRARRRLHRRRWMRVDNDVVVYDRRSVADHNSQWALPRTAASSRRANRPPASTAGTVTGRGSARSSTRSTARRSRTDAMASPPPTRRPSARSRASPGRTVRPAAATATARSAGRAHRRRLRIPDRRPQRRRRQPRRGLRGVERVDHLRQRRRGAGERQRGASTPTSGRRSTLARRPT